MPISNYPSNLKEAIQLGYLDKDFMDALQGKVAYRDSATRVPYNIEIGESKTFTRAGLIPIGSLDPFIPTNNTPLDNGMTTPAEWAVEQYTMPLNQWGDRVPDLNRISDQVAIMSRAFKNTQNLAIQATSKLDLIVQRRLLNAYMGGNTRVRVTLGAPAATVEVDDIRGFEKSFQNAFPTPAATSAQPVDTSVNATQSVLVGSNYYTLIGVTADLVNVSSAISVGGISGTLTFSAPVTVLDATLGNKVISTIAPKIVRPNNKLTTYDLAPTDVFRLPQLLAAVSYLRDNGVPTINGYYNCYIDNTSEAQLIQDPDYQRLYRGTEVTSETFKNAKMVPLLGVRFITTEFAPQQKNFSTSTPNTVIDVHRPIIMGEECLMEGAFQGMEAYMNEVNSEGTPGRIAGAKNIYMVTRYPLDRLLTFLSLSWTYVGEFVVPTDYLTDPTKIPTASNSYYKRAVVIEHA